MFGNDILFLQRFLKGTGHYSGVLDGLFGPITDKALIAFNQVSDEIADQNSRFDRRTEENIFTLHPAAQVKARQFLKEARKALPNDVSIKIISGTRTYVEQASIYAQGRTKPGRIVTNAGPGHSNHNFGIAWDVGLFKNGDYLDESELYKTVGAIGKSVGLEWGGDWSKFIDQPHYQLAVHLTLAELRNKFEVGSAFV